MTANLSKARVTIYSKPGCHLCDEAKANILASGCTGEFIFEEVNIETRADLLEQYRYDIPVVFIDGVKVFKHRVEAHEFRRKFRKLHR